MNNYRNQINKQDLLNNYQSEILMNKDKKQLEVLNINNF